MAINSKRKGARFERQLAAKFREYGFDDARRSAQYCGNSGGIRKALREIEMAPAVDTAPVVHGRWKYFHKQNRAVCTACSFERDLDVDFGRAVSCPNCGAKMNEEER